MSDTITISKTEYQLMKNTLQRYETIQKLAAFDFFQEPPVKNVGNIIRDFRGTFLYNENFLKSLERGLKESEHFNKKVK